MLNRPILKNYINNIFDYIKEKYSGEKSKLLFTNTVLLTQVIKTENIHDKIFSNK